MGRDDSVPRRLESLGAIDRSSTHRAAAWRLATILHGASRDSAEFIFGDSINSLTQDGGPKVDVEFRRSRPRQFDLVIGADGLHSNVRRLAFGPEIELRAPCRPLCRDFAAAARRRTGRRHCDAERPWQMRRAAPVRGRPLALLIFWHAEMTELDLSDVEEQKRILEKIFSDIGWDVPKILDEVQVSRELYFELREPRRIDRVGARPLAFSAMHPPAYHYSAMAQLLRLPGLTRSRRR